MRKEMTRLTGVVAGLSVLATLLAAGSCPCNQPADHTITIAPAQAGPGCQVIPDVSEVKSGDKLKFVNKTTSTLTLRFEAGVFTQADQVELKRDGCATLTAKPVTQQRDTVFDPQGCPNQPGPKIIVKP